MQQNSPRLLTVAAGSLLLIYRCHTSLPSVSMFSDTLASHLVPVSIFSPHLDPVSFFFLSPHFFRFIHFSLSLLLTLISAFSPPFSCSVVALMPCCCAFSFYLSMADHLSHYFFCLLLFYSLLFIFQTITQSFTEP